MSTQWHHKGIIDKQIKVINECYQDANVYDFDILATSPLRMDCGLFNCHFCCSRATEKLTEDSIYWFLMHCAKIKFLSNFLKTQFSYVLF